MQPNELRAKLRQTDEGSDSCTCSGNDRRCPVGSAAPASTRCTFLTTVLSFVAMDFRHPARSQRDRTRRENRHLNFYKRRDNLARLSARLQPDENLNQDLKHHLRSTPDWPTDRLGLEAAMRSFLRSVQRRPALVAAYFDGERVAYAAARTRNH